MCGIRAIIIFIFGTLGPVSAKIQMCRNFDASQNQYALLGNNATFTFCVTSPKHPGTEAAILVHTHETRCKENDRCNGKLIWSVDRIQTFNAYMIKVTIFNIENEDFHTTLILKVFDDDIDKEGVKFQPLTLKLKRLDEHNPFTQRPSSTTQPTSKWKKKKTPSSSTSSVLESSTQQTTSNLSTTARTETITRPIDKYASTSTKTSDNHSTKAQNIIHTNNPTVTKPSPLLLSTRTRTPVKSSTLILRETTTTNTVATTPPTTIKTTTTTATIKASSKHTTKPTIIIHTNHPSVTTTATSPQLPTTSSPPPTTRTTTQAKTILPTLVEDKTATSQPIRTDVVATATTPPPPTATSQPIRTDVEATTQKRSQFNSFTIELYGLSNGSDPEQVYSLLRNIEVITNPQRIYLTSEVTLIRVSCAVSDISQPEVTVRSTLIGRNNGVMTTEPVNSFRYHRPASFVGILGTLTCLVTNMYGHTSSSGTVEIANALETRIVSFQMKQLHLSRGDPMTLMCKTLGFPHSKIRIVQLRTGIPVVSKSSSKKNFLEWRVPNASCSVGGLYRCEAWNFLSSSLDVRETNIEIFDCPPYCPSQLNISQSDDETKLLLSWKPGFSSGDEQKFAIFVKANALIWRRHKDHVLLRSDVTFYEIAVADLSPQTNYSFKVVPWNSFVKGELSEAACEDTVQYSTYTTNQNKRLPREGEGDVDITKLSTSHLDASLLIIVISTVVIVILTALAIFVHRLTWPTKKQKHRVFDTTMDSLRRLSISDSAESFSFANGSGLNTRKLGLQSTHI